MVASVGSLFPFSFLCALLMSRIAPASHYVIVEVGCNGYHLGINILVVSKKNARLVVYVTSVDHIC
jgi:phospholipid N-methyltransferase